MMLSDGHPSRVPTLAEIDAWMSEPRTRRYVRAGELMVDAWSCHDHDAAPKGTRLHFTDHEQLETMGVASKLPGGWSGAGVFRAARHRIDDEMREARHRRETGGA